jgi:8-oxo-dGTP pyrophosphatase MutT (NUDIX family)
VERGETFDEALIRETQEEIGVTPVSYGVLSCISDPATPLEPITYHFYGVREWSGHPAILDQEHTELRWLPFEAAASLPGLALETYQPAIKALDQSTANLSSISSLSSHTCRDQEREPVAIPCASSRCAP